MKVPRTLIGKRVELQWMDPGSFKGRLPMPLGRAALATWLEHGVVHDVTDGVVILAHSFGRDAQATEVDEIHVSAIPEVLIEKLIVYNPETGGVPA